MTEQQKKTARRAVAQCDAYISRESARSADLRPADVQELLDWYIAHRAKLLKMLEVAAVA